MVINKSHNAKRNVIQGFINKFITLLCPFIIQTITVNTLGVEFLGVKGLFASVFTVLNLGELGIGAAISYCMYEPIAKDDYEKINALLNLYRKLYRIIGLIIVSLGLIIMPFIPAMIKDRSYPDGMNIYVVYFLYLINTSLSYWLFAYKFSLFNAYQRTDVLSAIGSVSSLLMYGIQIFILIYFKNFYYYLAVSVVFTAVNNLLISFLSDRMFPQLKCAGKVSRETKALLKEKVSGIAVGKLCGAARNSCDNIFISVLLGLTLTGIYNNYYAILSVLTGFLLIIYNSLLGGIGNSIQLKSEAENLSDMKKLDYAYMLISGWAAICFLCLCQPFMCLWMGEDKTLPDAAAYCLALYFYVLQMGNMRSMYSDAAGLYWENRARYIAETVSNIALNYILGRLLGVLGVILATLISLFVFGFISSAFITFKYYFKNGLAEYFKRHLIYFSVTAVTCLATYRVCANIHISGLIGLFAKAAVCVFVPAVCYLAIYGRTSIFKETKNWALSRLKK